MSYSFDSAESFKETENIILQLVSLLNTEVEQAVEILSCECEGTVYPA